MTKVTFAFVKNTEFYAIFSWIIRWFERLTGGPDASHAVVMFNLQNETMIAESVWPKSRVFPATSSYKKKYKIVESYTLDCKYPPAVVLSKLRCMVEDKPYSLSQNIFIGVCGLLVQFINPAKWSFLENKKFNGRARLNCTEVQMITLQELFGHNLSENPDNYSLGEARAEVLKVKFSQTKGQVDDLSIS